VSAFLPDRKCMHFMTITSARRTPGKLIDTRQNLQSIQPIFLETGILFYSTGALRLHDPSRSAYTKYMELVFSEFFYKINFEAMLDVLISQYPQFSFSKDSEESVCYNFRKSDGFLLN
jgi:hypothetical protein